MVHDTVEAFDEAVEVLHLLCEVLVVLQSLVVLSACGRKQRGEEALHVDMNQLVFGDKKVGCRILFTTGPQVTYLTTSSRSPCCSFWVEILTLRREISLSRLLAVRRTSKRSGLISEALDTDA